MDSGQGDVEQLQGPGSAYGIDRLADVRLDNLRFPSVRKPLRAKGGAAVTQYEYARRGIVTPEMEYIAIRENMSAEIREQDLARQHPGQGFGANIPARHHAGVCARRSGPRPRHHSRQHQPSGTRAHDHRPQFPGQDQRQHRQLRRRFRPSRRKSRKWSGPSRWGADTVMDLSTGKNIHETREWILRNSPGAHRHGADLSGAGKSRRQGRGTDLGNLSRHPDRTGRAGRGLFHHSCGRSAALHSHDGQTHDRHRVAAAAPSWPSGAWRITRKISSTRIGTKSAKSCAPTTCRFSIGDGLRPGSIARRQRRGPIRRTQNAGRPDQKRLGAWACR